MTGDKQPIRLLFICDENCNCSQMAEAFARMYGAGRVEAYSAGFRPSGRVHPKAIDAMRELGYDLTRHQSKGFADLPDVEFDVAVMMGSGDIGTDLRARVRENWNVPCSKAMPPEQFRGVRDLIGEKVQALLKKL
jgi:protein-tyrosine-phosphatase